MPVVGLTGSICSGKSTIARFLAQMGAAVIDADEIGHEAYQPHSETWQQVADAFGRGILTANGQIDRRKLGEIVFKDPEALRRLNGIMHPGMHRVAGKMIERLKNEGARVIVLEAPLLVEANWLDLVDEVWVAQASEENSLKRCRDRSGLSEDQARARLASQLAPEEKAKHADVLIDTNVSLAEVEARVRELWEQRLTKDKTRVSKEAIRKALAGRQKQLEPIAGCVPAAVLLPLFYRGDDYHLVFTKRTETVSYHKGQVSFPGGRPHPEDRSLRDAALRETWEEIGLPPGDAEILGELDDIATYTTNFVISPFVAAIPYPHQFKANPAEVAEIIEVPLRVLQDKSNFEEETVEVGGREIPQYIYHYRDRVIFGATARIVKHFLEVIGPPWSAGLVPRV